AAASTVDAAGPAAAGAGDADAGTDANGGGVLACSAFSSVSLTLMSEWCVCPAGGCPAQTAVDLRLASLSYLSAGCLCQHDADCDVGTVCRKDAWPESAHCRATSAGCPGVCVP